MNGPLAPVVLLIYRRPDLTKLVFEEVRKIRPKSLYIVADGPDAAKTGDESRVRAAREAVNSVDWDCQLTQIFAEKNMGLKNRITSGLDEVFAREDCAIILEDDCLPSGSFFRFASELLQRFEFDERVGLVSGSQRLRGKRLSLASYEFSKDVRIWGWATWARTWNKFSQSGDVHAQWTKKEARIDRNLFPAGPRRRSMESMMREAESLDSWAIPFAVHCVKMGYLNVVPSQNLISNIGVGNDSTHTAFENWVVDVPRGEISFPLVHKEKVVDEGHFDSVEARSDLRQLIGYPLRHPFDALSRIAKFLLNRLGFKQRRSGTLS